MALTKVTYGLLSADTSAIDLNIDANTLYVDSSANKVGIGTNSPESFPNPLGNLLDFDCIKMEVVGAVEAHKKITFDLYSITSFVSESITLTPVALFLFSSYITS